VLFVSVGVEQLIDPLKVRFMGWALHLACYRSYRDDASRRRARRLLSLSSADPLYPDLAFSLPESLFSECQQSPASEPTVAVGIYAVELGPNEVRDYVERIGTFLLRLLECGRRVRVVIGDVYYDEVARQQLRAWLEERNVYDRIVDEAATSFQELIRQLAEADFVVATRFHNLVLALLVGKPVVSISHMEKNDELMAAMGLPEYSLPLRDAQPEQLLQRLAWMECRAGELRRLIGERIQEYRARLEEQYATVFTRLTDRGGERRLR
jgi:polysaccharide pyruvyl transferase WcaK-like protein